MTGGYIRCYPPFQDLGASVPKVNVLRKHHLSSASHEHSTAKNSDVSWCVWKPHDLETWSMNIGNLLFLSVCFPTILSNMKRPNLWSQIWFHPLSNDDFVQGCSICMGAGIIQWRPFTVITELLLTVISNSYKLLITVILTVISRDLTSYKSYL